MSPGQPNEPNPTAGRHDAEGIGERIRLRLRRGAHLPVRTVTIEPDERSARHGPSWEHRRSYGNLQAAIFTASEVMFRPFEAFAHARREGGFGAPLFFFILLFSGFNWVSIAVGQGWRFYLARPLLLGEWEFLYNMTPGKAALAGALILMAAAPLVPVVLTVVATVVLNVLMLLVGASRAGFEATWRVVAYSGGAVSVLCIIPYAGRELGLLWFALVTFVGLPKMHETSPWRLTLVYAALAGAAVAAIRSMGIEPEKLLTIV